ncbi:MAG: integration host factor subunit beta [Treponema sp.]|jgi:integration host factor subunit beta|nr:integration host factor subunit beta [Treponema sp.]
MASKKVTKNDLVEAIYFKSDFEKYKIQEIIEKFLEEVKASLENGSTIELRGFGTFEPRLRKGRSVARNPKTGEQLSVAPHYVAAFRAGQEMKKALWELEVKAVD